MSRGMGPERVDPDAALAAQAAHVFPVHHLEAKAEAVAHLALPLAAQARRADHEDLADLVAQH